MYYNDVPVGTVCCRLEQDGGRTRLYVMTMGVLAVRPPPHVLPPLSRFIVSLHLHLPPSSSPLLAVADTTHVRPQPYRSRGVGSKCLEHIIAAAAAHNAALANTTTNTTASPSPAHIDAIYLHVQVSNPGAKAFYARHGFAEVALYEGYYKKLVPHDAWVLERAVDAV